MELYNTTLSYGETQHIIKITGNSRIRVINDFESNLIKQKYINVKQEYGNPVIYLTVINNSVHELKKNKEVCISFIYKYGMPYVSDVCNLESEHVYYSLYPIYPIHDETYKTLNITKKIKIDIYEYNKAYREHTNTKQIKRYNEFLCKSLENILIENDSKKYNEDSEYEYEEDDTCDCEDEEY
jgi:hypothetical protein